MMLSLSMLVLELEVKGSEGMEKEEMTHSYHKRVDTNNHNRVDTNNHILEGRNDSFFPSPLCVCEFVSQIICLCGHK